MGDQVKKFTVHTEKGVETVYASSCSFTVSGDLVFEDENRDFLKTYARGYWREVTEVKESN